MVGRELRSMRLRRVNSPSSLETADPVRNRRLAAFRPAPPKYQRGYGKLFLDHITQADQGCDFDFLRAIESANG